MAERSNKDEAQAQFAKVQRANDAKKAMADYEAEAVAVRAKTARLKALRLARDAELATTATAAPKTKSAKTRSARSKKAASSTLSAWLESETNAGRRS